MPNSAQPLLDEIDKEMNTIVDRIFAVAQDNLNKSHTKKFKSGRSASVITTDTGLLSMTANIDHNYLEKNIVFPAKYASDVEYGNAGTPVNMKDIKKWVRRKLFKGRGSEFAINRTAMHIAKSLESRGQSPDPFLGPAITQVRNEMNI